jgi:hypothetical protein
MKPPKETTNSSIQAEWWSCAGLVYFFGAGNPIVAIKIGVTALTKKTPSIAEAIRRRHREIQTSNHEAIQLLGLIHFTEGDRPMRSAEILERELHIRFHLLQRFAPHKRAAEWFNASPDLLAYIAQYAQAPEAFSVSRTLHT